MINPRCIVPLVLSALCFVPAIALAQNTDNTLPEMTPEFFPSVTPLPARRPTATPSPEITPTPLPVITPDPRMTRPPMGIGKPELAFDLPEVTEGQAFALTLTVKGAVASFPIQGEVIFNDFDYKMQAEKTEKVPFTLTGPEPQEVLLHFRTPGKKTFRIETATPILPTRNVLAYVKPFVATVFPQPIERQWSKNPKDWRVLVNLQHSASQRQYYQVIHKDEVVQRLLTSSATANKVTPTGKFKLGIKAASPKSTLYESVMPFWTTIRIPGYSFEYGNHGLTGESYLYYLGQPASHGCLRLSNKWIKQNGEWLNIGGAKWVYEHVPVGSPIHIYRQAHQPFAFENYRSWVNRSK